MITELSPDTVLYRFEQYTRIKAFIRHQKLSLVNYKKFHENDPWEKFVFNSFIKHNETLSKSFFGRDNVFMMCFTDKCAIDSDALWRIYAKSNDKRVLFATTVEKLKNIFNNRQVEYLLGRVTYTDDMLYKDKRVNSFYVDRKIRTSLNEDKTSGDKNIIHGLLYKRICFAYEKEIRLIAWSKEKITSNIIEVNIEPDDIFDEIVFDPWITDEEYENSYKELRSLGVDKRKIHKSKLHDYKPYFYDAYKPDPYPDIDM